jgi:hypothetical protein
MSFQAAMRAACVTLLTDYAADQEPPLKLQVYPGRPRTLFPPTAFVDGLRETINYTPGLNQRIPTADVVVVFGLFDSKDAADQKDAFVDGFIEWTLARYHAAGANTLIAVTDVDDLPDYVPEWIPPDQQRTYYATRISLEGLALTA